MRLFAKEREQIPDASHNASK